MAINYTWKVVGLKKKTVDSFDNTIVNVQWEKHGTDDTDGVSGFFPGATPLDITSLSSGSFTSYENLTESQVLGWIQDIVTNDYIYELHINEYIEKMIEETRSNEETVKTSQLPWG